MSFVIKDKDDKRDNVPMNDFTQKENEKSKIIELKNVVEQPSEDTVFFLRMFARAYEPSMMVAV